MYVLGIVGGVASGKSAVAEEFSRIGLPLLDADALGHAVLHDPDVIAAFRDRWGAEVIDEQGQVVRRAVARRVFGDDTAARDERQFLNSVTHPRIRDRLRERLEELRRRGAPMAVIDAALLYETGWSQLCDAVVFVDVPRELRVQRAAARGWSEEEFAAREASQWSVQEKKARATWVLDNGGARSEISPQVALVWERIQAEM
jgi:dephospho-CoA kinase